MLIKGIVKDAAGFLFLREENKTMYMMLKYFETFMIFFFVSAVGIFTVSKAKSMDKMSVFVFAVMEIVYIGAAYFIWF